MNDSDEEYEDDALSVGSSTESILSENGVEKLETLPLSEKLQNDKLYQVDFIPGYFLEVIPGLHDVQTREIMIQGVKDSLTQEFLSLKASRTPYRLVIDETIDGSKHYINREFTKKIVVAKKNVGLNNSGVDCHLLSAIQMLYRIPPFKQFLMEYRKDLFNPTAINIKAIQTSSLYIQALLANIFSLFDKSKSNILLDEKSPVYSYINTLIMGLYKEKKQQDARETLMYLMGSMFTFLRVKSIHYKKDTTKPKEDIQFINTEFNTILSLGIKDRKTIQDCILQEQSEETLSETNLIANNSGTKRFNKTGYFFELGEWVIIQLKRFDSQNEKELKLKNEIEYHSFTIETPDSNEAKYEAKYKVQGCIVHIGASPKSGHYYYVEFDEKGDIYTVLNDSAIQSGASIPDDINTILLENGYIFLYKRVGVKGNVGDDGEEGADREGADREGADREGADREGADREGADREGADGEEGTGGEGADREGAGGEEGTGGEGAGGEGAGGEEGTGGEGAGGEGAGGEEEVDGKEEVDGEGAGGEEGAAAAAAAAADKKAKDAAAAAFIEKELARSIEAARNAAVAAAAADKKEKDAAEAAQDKPLRIDSAEEQGALQVVPEAEEEYAQKPPVEVVVKAPPDLRELAEIEQRKRNPALWTKGKLLRRRSNPSETTTVTNQKRYGAPGLRQTYNVRGNKGQKLSSLNWELIEDPGLPPQGPPTKKINRLRGGAVIPFRAPRGHETRKRRT